MCETYKNLQKFTKIYKRLQKNSAKCGIIWKILQLFGGELQLLCQFGRRKLTFVNIWVQQFFAVLDTDFLVVKW